MLSYSFTHNRLIISLALVSITSAAAEVEGCHMSTPLCEFVQQTSDVQGVLMFMTLVLFEVLVQRVQHLHKVVDRRRVTFALALVLPMLAAIVHRLGVLDFEHQRFQKMVRCFRHCLRMVVR